VSSNKDAVASVADLAVDGAPIAQAATEPAPAAAPIARQADKASKSPARLSLRDKVRLFYNGPGPQSQAFRIAVVLFDIATLVFFIVTTFELGLSYATTHAIAVAIAVLIAIDWSIRLWISPSVAKHFTTMSAWIDPVIVTTIILEFFVDQLVFLRVLRAVGLFRTFKVLDDLKENSPFFVRNEDVLQSSVNLLVFVSVCASIVFVTEQGAPNSQIEDFLDALYFTVAALTTTGFGDVTLQGDLGRIISILIMIFGVSLFLRLLQTIFRPVRVHRTCPDCGLERHEMDASHCKHCGHVIHIRTEGAS